MKNGSGERKKEKKEVTQSIYKYPACLCDVQDNHFSHSVNLKTSCKRCCYRCGYCSYIEPFTALCRLQAHCPRHHLSSVEHQRGSPHFTIYYCNICTDKGRNHGRDTNVLPDLSYSQFAHRHKDNS